jgi:hypothetical protein
MLTKILYNLCFLLLLPYENLNLIHSDFDYLDNCILEKIYLRKLFDFKQRKKKNYIFKNFHFDYNFNILDEDHYFIKLLLNLKISFIIEDSIQNIPSACIRNYVIILEHLNNKFRLKLLIENEENPPLYNYLLNTDFFHIYNLIYSKDQKLYEHRISPIDLLPKVPEASILLSENNFHDRKTSNFNVDEACTYAETYALNPNPNYKSFEGIGGDCTNFISQILHAGGFKETPIWKPYTNAWVRVEEIYSYLTSQKLGIKLPNDSYLDRGCLIQFYTPTIGKYFHNGFITYKLQNNDCLYCCHSYNKLNYPLSEIYPNRYPTLRALKFD